VEQWLDTLQVAEPHNYGQKLMRCSGGWGELLKLFKAELDHNAMADPEAKEGIWRSLTFWEENFGLTESTAHLFRLIVEIYCEHLDKLDERGYCETDFDLREFKELWDMEPDLSHCFDFLWNWAVDLGYVRAIISHDGSEKWRINRIFTKLPKKTIT